MPPLGTLADSLGYRCWGLSLLGASTADAIGCCHVYLTWRFLNGDGISTMIDYRSKWSLSLSVGSYILAGWFALIGDDVLDLENYQLVAVITQENYVLVLYAAWLTMVFTMGGGSLIISLVADACLSLPPGTHYGEGEVLSPKIWSYCSAEQRVCFLLVCRFGLSLMLAIIGCSSWSS
ncbi:hypothetical protein NC653_024470 [Populus alba x Populus x berolinensis]|uniref:Uncharacterized protein n=1 Tax=Populus alba x Populus x berolinensis TaxID=444605 RepID=A0AAD6M9Q2_9ROSI|nr:hypothetical protein NC653_024470 [Populus alba x Populus x berolinensis]